MSVEVGVARWDVVLSPEGLAELAQGPELSEAAMDRLMVNVRAKALRLRWYGGGTMTIDAGELIDEPPEARLDENGQPLPRLPWYRLIESRFERRTPRRLKSV